MDQMQYIRIMETLKADIVDNFSVQSWYFPYTGYKGTPTEYLESWLDHFVGVMTDE